MGSAREALQEAADVGDESAWRLLRAVDTCSHEALEAALAHGSLTAGGAASDDPGLHLVLHWMAAVRGALPDAA